MQDPTRREGRGGGEGTGCSQEEPGEGERPILRNRVRATSRGLHDGRRLSLGQEHARLRRQY